MSKLKEYLLEKQEKSSEGFLTCYQAFLSRPIQSPYSTEKTPLTRIQTPSRGCIKDKLSELGELL